MEEARYWTGVVEAWQQRGAPCLGPRAQVWEHQKVVAEDRYQTGVEAWCHLGQAEG